MNSDPCFWYLVNQISSLSNNVFFHCFKSHYSSFSNIPRKVFCKNFSDISIIFSTSTYTMLCYHFVIVNACWIYSCFCRLSLPIYQIISAKFSDFQMLRLSALSWFTNWWIQILALSTTVTNTPSLQNKLDQQWSKNLWKLLIFLYCFTLK